EALTELASYLGEARGNLIAASQIKYGELTVTTTVENLIALLTFLRDDAKCGFVNLIDICWVDWPQRELLFDVVYHLLSPKKNLRILVGRDLD
ncbi:NADH-quinone oxidoreductase subunit C, partial [Rhizobium ruizarguesonis]